MQEFDEKPGKSKFFKVSTKNVHLKMARQNPPGDYPLHIPIIDPNPDPNPNPNTRNPSLTLGNPSLTNKRQH